MNFFKKLTFVLTDSTDIAIQGLHFVREGGKLSCTFSYDYDERPLVLQADAAVGDRVEIRLLPYRIELYVNGRLVDEEWPCGRVLYDPAQLPDTVLVENFVPKKEELPAVVGTMTFKTAVADENGRLIFS